MRAKDEKKRSQTGQAILNGAQSQTDALNQGAQSQIDSINTGQQNIDDQMATQAGHLADVLSGWQTRIGESAKESQLSQQQDRTRLAFAGVTEFANALTNMLGVSKGARHQQQKTYAADWMQQADNHRKYYKEERMRLEQQAQAAQSELDRFNLMREEQAAKAQQQIAALKADTGVKTAAINAQAEVQAAQADDAERKYEDTLAQQKETNRIRQEQINANAAKQGLIPDGKGGYTFSRELKESLASSKMPSNYSPVVTGIDDNGQPIVRVGDYLALGRNIKNLIDAGRVTDLDEEGQLLLEQIKKDVAGDWEGKGADKNDEVAKRLTSLVTHSPILQKEAERTTDPLTKYFNDNTPSTAFTPTESIDW